MKLAHVLFLVVFLGISTRLTWGHSWVACTDYKITDSSKNYWDANMCKGYPRNWQSVASTFGEDRGYNYQSTESQACRDPLSSGTYPSAYPMATYAPGQQVCLAWPSKNHVAATCTNQYIPDTELKIYATKTGSADPTQSGFERRQIADMGGHVNGQIDFKGFQNCPKFCENMDKSLCSGCFNLPSDMEEGTWSFQWYWVFNAGSAPYTTCWEARVSKSGTVATSASATSSVATSAAAATSTSTSGAAATSTSGAATSTGPASSTTGSSGTTGCETVIITTSPKTIGQSTNFNVTVAYVAPANRDIVVDLMRGSNWFGKGIATVPAGKGSVTLTVTPQNGPSQGSNYELHAWSVDQGQATVDGSWNRAKDHAYQAIIVGNSVSY